MDPIDQIREIINEGAPGQLSRIAAVLGFGESDQFLAPDDMAALKRFCECCEDSGADGHDVPKEAMRRLAEIGVVRSMGFGRHTVTSFGDYVMGTHLDLGFGLPLKTLAEYNEDAKARAQQKGGAQ